MKISIVTTVRNAAGSIARTLASVAAQRRDGYELEYLVIDGASTDGTLDAIRAFAAAPHGENFSCVWISEPDAGLYDGLNKGIRRATGELVGILNADDCFDGDDVLARVAAAWRKAQAEDPAVDALYGNIRFVDPASVKDGVPTSAWRTRRVCFARRWHPWMQRWGYMPPHPGLFIRRACYERWGLYSADRARYPIAADCELLIRFFRVHGMKGRYMDVCTTAMMPGGLSTRGAKAVLRLNREVVRANRDNGYFCCLPMLVPKFAFKVFEVLLPRLGLTGRGQGRFNG